MLGLDNVPALVKLAESNIRHSDQSLLSDGYVKLQVGDGWEGAPGEGPFDIIHVGAAVQTVPGALVSQLAKGGRMLLPVGDGPFQDLVLVTKDSNNRISQKKLPGKVMFVPLRAKTYSGSSFSHTVLGGNAQGDARPETNTDLLSDASPTR